MADYRENVVSTILPLSLRNSELLSDVLPALSEHSVFDLKKLESLQGAVSEINNFLNSSKKRLQGLLLLEHVLAQCSPEVFSSCCQTWMDLLLQTLQSHAPAEQHRCTLQVLSTLIMRVTAFPELSRDVGAVRMKSILPAVLALTSKGIKEAMASCLNTCILQFPGATGLFKNKIETFVIEQLDKVCPSQVFIRCYTLLARCTAGGHGGEKYREAWTAHYEKLMSTLKNLLTQLYAGLETGEDVGEDAVFISAVPNTQPEQTVCLVRRFNTLCGCLAALLREPFPTWVQVPMDEILRLVCRTLAVHMHMLVKKATVDQLLLLTYLPLMHCAAFNVLSHLIVCVKRLLIPSAEMVGKLCVQTLSSTHLHKTTSTSQASFRKLRESVYQTLETWLQVAGPCCGIVRQVVRGGRGSTEVGGLADLLAEIYSDISQQQREALQIEKPKVNDGSAHPPAKKKKKKGKHNNYQELAVDSHVLNPQGGKDTTVAALKVLQHLIDNCGLQLPESNFYALKRKVLCLTSEMQHRTLPPYTFPECRLELYKVLLSSVSVPRPDPALLDQPVCLFQRGAQDPQLKVAITCREALARCQNLIHPTVPCLRAPVTKPLYTPSPMPTLSDSTITTTTNITTDAAITQSAAGLQLSSSPQKSFQTLPGSNTPRHALTDPSSSGVSTGDPPELQQKQVVPSTSGISQQLGVDLSSTKRKRTSSDEESSADDGDDEDREGEGREMEEEGGEREEGEEEDAEDPKPSQSQGAVTMETVVHGEMEESKEKGEGEKGGCHPEEMNTNMSVMMQSFVPCEAESDEEMSDSD